MAKADTVGKQIDDQSSVDDSQNMLLPGASFKKIYVGSIPKVYVHRQGREGVQQKTV